MSDIDTAVVDSLKALDPERPIREAVIVVIAMTHIVAEVTASPLSLRFGTFSCENTYSTKTLLYAQQFKLVCIALVLLRQYFGVRRQ